ncbi:hypothetical protein SteCoe_35549 [Stentor coeruleus]|uniref:PCI domain-containing protein n=1 Tax=Stentor coeruleus TaxID=5963 RepID=A0A1R2ASE2_9CILI|nr:hypothetical protein SteCoe_35549 [Stentor coeruleus]
MEAALEQYLILAKTAKGKACEALICQAISNPKTYVFGELIDAVQDGGVSREALLTLEIFAYGTLSDYRAQKLPELTPQQLKKIQMLTLVTLASKEPVLSYKSLLGHLEISSTRQLEDLIIDTIYEGLIKGKIDHKNSCLRVFEAIGRDLKPENIPDILTKISDYILTIEKLEKDLSRNLEELNLQKSVALTHKQQFDKEFTDQKESVKACVNQTKENTGLIGKIKKQFNLGK